MRYYEIILLAIFLCTYWKCTGTEDLTINELNRLKAENVELKMNIVQKEYDNAVRTLTTEFKAIITSECSSKKITNCDTYTIDARAGKLVPIQQPITNDVGNKAVIDLEKQKLAKPKAPPKN